MNEAKFISVILPLKLEWEPCYSTTSDLHVGERVRVMFAGKVYVGTVSAVGIVPDMDPGRIKPIVSVEDSLEDIFPEEIELWRRVAQYYMCTIGEVYKAAYPSGKINLEEARAAAREKYLRRKKRILKSIEQKQEKLKERLEKKENEASTAKERTKRKESIIRSIDRLQEEISRVHEALTRAEQAYSDAEKGTVRYTGPQGCSSIILSPAQKKAEDEIHQGFESQHPVLLHGVTGSGKTEIYIRLAAEAIGNGKNVLYLVPEIALSHQLEERLYEHFGESLMTFHSGETAAVRMNTAETIRQTRRNGGTYIILGTRSSLYLPHHNLGLIIVDEEHDSSYKQTDPAPRYSARDLAVVMAKLFHARLILGSATPSFESYFNAKNNKYHLVTLNQRFAKIEMPEIIVDDLKIETRRKTMQANFGKTLVEAIKQTLQEKNQIILFQNRRGFSLRIECDHCKYIPYCINCDVSLTYHKNQNILKCHYCGYTCSLPAECPSCHSTDLKMQGFGTERIEDDIQILFPDARTARLDLDTTRSKNSYQYILEQFQNKETDILVGTQMVTKGLDFDDVKTVGVLNADNLLSYPDFRAFERAFQLMEQVSGRAGRKNTKGKVIIQTYQPQHPVILNVINHDYQKFYEEQMPIRRQFNYPPYSRLILIRLKDREVNKLNDAANELAKLLRQAFKNNLLGPEYPVISRVKNLYIKQMMIKINKELNSTKAKAFIKNTIENFKHINEFKSVKIQIDVDP